MICINEAVARLPSVASAVAAVAAVAAAARGGRREEEAKVMSIDRAVMAFAGFGVLLSLALSRLHSPYRPLLTAFAGLNPVLAPFTGFCPAARVFKWLGLSRAPAFS